MKKRTYLLAIIILISVPLIRLSYGFSDVLQTNDYYEAIEYVFAEGIVKGYPDGTYRPLDYVNRAEFSKIIVGAKLNRNPLEASRNCFPDVVESEWYSSYVCYASGIGIIYGYPDGTFKPHETINFAEAAKILVNTFDIQHTTPQGKEWFSLYTESLNIKNVVPPSVLSPNQIISREEMAEFILRIMSDNKSSTNNDSILSPFEISILGDDRCVEETTRALDLLKSQAKEYYEEIEMNVGIIECTEDQSGMLVAEYPPRYEVGKATYTASITWYASTIAHDACHSKQYHDYFEENDIPAPDIVYTGRYAEAQCLDVQYEVLNKIGADQTELSHLSEIISTEYWDVNYEERWW